MTFDRPRMEEPQVGGSEFPRDLDVLQSGKHEGRVGLLERSDTTELRSGAAARGRLSTVMRAIAHSSRSGSGRDDGFGGRGGTRARVSSRPCCRRSTASARETCLDGPVTVGMEDVNVTHPELVDLDETTTAVIHGVPNRAPTWIPPTFAPSCCGSSRRASSTPSPRSGALVDVGAGGQPHDESPQSARGASSRGPHCSHSDSLNSDPAVRQARLSHSSTSRFQTRAPSGVAVTR